MNIIGLAKQAGLVRNGDIGMKRWEGPQSDSISDQDLEKFAALVAAQERDAWEHKFARLHQLMDIREIQPNKPCCLAARADEREACARKASIALLGADKALTDRVLKAIRARGTT